jgi:hypothetical protein
MIFLKKYEGALRTGALLERDPASTFVAVVSVLASHQR